MKLHLNLVCALLLIFIYPGTSVSDGFSKSDIEIDENFKQFVTRFNKSYVNDAEEYDKRKNIFKQSLERHSWLNAKEQELGGSAVYGVNVFSDLTPQEFKEFLKRGSVLPRHKLLKNKNKVSKTSYQCDAPKKETPARWNWKEKGKVTEIKNQGMCGSCWAFTAVQLVESQWAIKTGVLKHLSVQELVSCGAGLGCNGGNTCSALNWMISGRTVNHTILRYTIAPESECPYEDKKTSCDDSLKHSAAGVTINYPCCKYNADEMTYIKPIVAFIGTVAVNVDATMWHDYISGVIQHHCSAREINHAVQIVGYDATGVVPYWIVRNSWGTQFGDNGYLYIKMGSKLCGINKEATYVVV